MWVDLEHQREWRKKNSEHCKNYGKEWRMRNPNYKKEWKKEYLRECNRIMHELKINGCAICGYNKCDRALQFHHVNPKDKNFNVTSNQMSNKKLVDEFHKCILLCANCHMEIHALKNPP